VASSFLCRIDEVAPFGPFFFSLDRRDSAFFLFSKGVVLCCLRGQSRRPVVLKVPNDVSHSGLRLSRRRLFQAGVSRILGSLSSVGPQIQFDFFFTFLCWEVV